MNKTALSKHPLLTGTILLTLAGLLSRMIGFFYRIFLSHTIGAEGLGIYQLIFPIYALTFSLTVAGIQTAISRYVAAVSIRSLTGGLGTDAQPYGSRRHGSGIDNSRQQSFGQRSSVYSSMGRQPGSITYLYAGLALSLLLSFLCTFFLYQYAEALAIHVLKEVRCVPLLKILSLTVPFGAIHACVNGYYYGLQKTSVPAISQLSEQLARVGGVYLMYLVASEQGRPVTIEMAVWGLVIGEIVSVLYSVSFTRFHKSRGGLSFAMGQLAIMAAPLTVSRVLINLFQSMEAILIPGRLQAFGYQADEALSVYGVLTGMAMPMIFFPSAIANSVSVMLLPAISEAQAKQDHEYIKKAVKKSCFYCLVLGLSCTLVFLLLGRLLGRIMFANQLAGTFIMVLGWICPFLYLTTTLSSILNGLGKTGTTMLLNLISSGIRILFVAFLIPSMGIKAYLFGMLVSHLFDSGAAVLILRKLVWGKA